MARRAIVWEDEALELLEQAPPRLASAAEARLSAVALEEGQPAVTAPMVQDLLRELGHWGWDGVFGDYARADPTAIYDGFFGAKDAEAAASWLAAGGTGAGGDGIADFCVESLELRPGARLLDLGCGNGRVAIPLARRGVAVTGVEMSEDWVAVARAWAMRDGVLARLIHADLRAIPFPGLAEDASFDAILSIGVLFEHLPESDEQAQRLLGELHRLLCPGGHCLIFISGFSSRTHPGAYPTEPGTGAELRNLWTVRGPRSFRLIERRFPTDESRFFTRYIRVDPGRRPSESREILRYYTRSELSELLDEAGLSVRRRWGATNAGGPYTGPYTDYTDENPTLIILARKDG